MRAFGFDARPEVGGFSDALQVFELDRPAPGRDEVRVRVRATSINVDDIHIIEGTFVGGAPVGPKPSPKRVAIPGHDFSGVVDAIGEGVDIPVGTEVYGLYDAFEGSGPWADFVVVPVSRLSTIPSGVTFEEAAAAPMSGTTALCAVDRSGVGEGQTCLVVGASGGVGSLCVQALASLGVEVWGVCSTPNVELVRSLGASVVIDYKERPLAETLRDRGVRFACALDFVGGRELERSVVPYVDRSGRFVTVVGPVAHVGDTRLGAWGLARMVGYIGRRVLGSRLRGPRYHFAVIGEPDFQRIERLIFEQGKRAMIDRVLPLELDAVREGVAHVLSHRARGRVVLSASQD
ncbi:MAG: NAD(P)-dependent alcohol dehydrogenase [Myxococcota bacterium]